MCVLRSSFGRLGEALLGSDVLLESSLLFDQLRAQGRDLRLGGRESVGEGGLGGSELAKGGLRGSEGRLDVLQLEAGRLGLGLLREGGEGNLLQFTRRCRARGGRRTVLDRYLAKSDVVRVRLSVSAALSLLASTRLSSIASTLNYTSGGRTPRQHQYSNKRNA